jgi:hypothetical protein
MHRLRWFIAALIAAAASPQQKPEIADLSFMAGCWEVRDGAARIQETWLKPSGGTMIGMSRTVKEGKTASAEFMTIRQDESGLVLQVQVGLGGRPIPFRLIRLSPAEAVFSNHEHDFPQRIVYRHMPTGLFARTEGMVEGKERAMDYAMEPASCR